MAVAPVRRKAGNNGMPEQSAVACLRSKKWPEPLRSICGGMLNTVVLQASNGASESMNSRIQILKVPSRGFRNKARYIQAIYFHFGGLDLYPEWGRR